MKLMWTRPRTTTVLGIISNSKHRTGFKTTLTLQDETAKQG